MKLKEWKNVIKLEEQLNNLNKENCKKMKNLFDENQVRDFFYIKAASVSRYMSDILTFSTIIASRLETIHLIII